MRILFLTFYLRPDLCAGAFRATALLEQLQKVLSAGVTIDVVTTAPNRYKSFDVPSGSIETNNKISINRIPVPLHQSGLIDQSRTFAAYALGVLRHTWGVKYDLVIATSSRLMTAFLGALVSRRAVPLYLDIRDIFLDTIADVFRGPLISIALPIISSIEKFTILSATRVNLVSPGFQDYFSARYPQAHFDFFTNGIDEEFLLENWDQVVQPAERKRKRVLYAGNIGQGQGLHSILPELAAATAGTHEFIVVGDGGARRLLEEAVAKRGLDNVQICRPVDRRDLIHHYHAADVLFLHLNDLDAFKKVLPSKIFEYATTGKPLLAGVAGYAKSFIIQEIVNARTFNPCDIEGAVEALNSLRPGYTERGEFISRCLRRNIMRSMAEAIVKTM